MAKQVWVAEDGTQFDSEQKAQKHDENTNLNRVLGECMARSFKETISNILNHPQLAVAYIGIPMKEVMEDE